jgi:hypothetical protein
MSWLTALTAMTLTRPSLRNADALSALRRARGGAYR